MCYLAPEQTGTTDILVQDHRTDLYSLGILFWTALVGRGRLPFEGPPMCVRNSRFQQEHSDNNCREMLREIVQTKPVPTYEVNLKNVHNSNDASLIRVSDASGCTCCSSIHHRQSKLKGAFKNIISIHEFLATIQAT